MSTSVQEDSPETQRRMLGEYASRAGHDIVGEYLEEATSGGLPTEKRPVLLQLLADVGEKRRDFDGILVLHRDRFGRDPESRAENIRYLIRKKCPLWTPDGEVKFESPYEIMTERVMSAMSEFERRIAGLRVKEHNIARALQGLHPSGYAPLGLRWDKTAKRWETTDRANDAVIVFRTFIEHNGNAAETARALNRLGLRGARGRPFSNKAVLLIIRCPAYRQQIAYAGRVAEAPDIPRIIPEALIAAADALLHVTAPMRKSKAAPSPYAGLLYCAHCGSKLHLMHHRRTETRYGPAMEYTGFRCPARTNGLCESKIISERILDSLVGRAVQQLVNLHDVNLPTVRHETPTPSRRQHARLTEQRARWAKLYAEELISWQDMEENVRRIDAELKRLEQPRPSLPLTADLMRDVADSLEGGWQNVPLKEKRALLLLLHASIAVESQAGSPRAIEIDCPDLPLIRVVGKHIPR